MSRILDILPEPTAAEAVVSYEEKGVVAYLVAALGSVAVYVVVVLRRADGGPLAEVAYVVPMLWTLAVSVGISVLARVVLEAVRPSDSSLADARDEEISRAGDRVGGLVLAIGAAGVLALTMVEADHFWIANALYVTFDLQAVVASLVKLRAYRVGL